jgi:DNA-binding ferritin-like protein
MIDMNKDIQYPPKLQSLIEKKASSRIEDNNTNTEDKMNETLETTEKTAAVSDSPESLRGLASHFRAMQFLAHNAHNLIGGVSFFSDHDFFGALYGEYEASYDRVIELLIGNGDKPDLVALHIEAAGKLSSLSKENHFEAVLGAEEQLQSAIEEFAKTNPSQAALNMAGDLGETSKVRIYKLRQRLAS